MRRSCPLTLLVFATAAPESRHQLLAAATILLALPSLVGTLFVASATVLVPACA